ncbi:MAG TPA: AsmA-like C-terminal region-containing protein, partial [Rhizobiaceae bacterium]|nr:AsmA-like C-terminal region-containing protein [Rhizobiaceae bacterium]
MIALFTALLAPFFVDWTSHRAAFEAEASRIIGQPVKVSGAARMRILPLPRVTFSDISVGNYEDGAPMMTADAFTMDAELMPFLRGEVRIVDMRLDKPHVLIRVNESGAIAWTQRKEALVEQVKVKLERLVVSGGSFDLEGLAGGRRIRGEGFDAEISAEGLTGPWRISATGAVDGVPSEFSVTTGRIQEEGSLRVAIDARRFDQPYRLTVDGPVEMRDGVLAWNGAFRISPATGEGGKPEPGALPVVASGAFFATPNAVEAPEYRLEIGDRDDPYTITGRGVAQIREEISFRIEADGRQIDIDQLSTGSGDGGQPAAGLATRLAALRSIVDAIPVPQARGEIDFELPAIVAGDTVIREVSALIRPDGDGWQVARLKSTLPGNTTFEASGRIGVRDNFGFEGDLLLASRQPTGFANWLSGASDASLRRLKSAGLSARASLGPQKAEFNDLELVLDGVSIRGSLRREERQDTTPLLTAILEGEAIDLEDLRAIQALTGEGAGSVAGHDLDLTLKTALLRADGMEAADVDVELRMERGSISVDRLNAGEFYGARIESSGKIDDLFGRASGNMSLAIKAEDGGGLVNLARERLGENRFLDALSVDPALTEGLDVTLSLDARPEGEGAKASFNATGTMGGAGFELHDNFEGRPAQWGEAWHGITAKISHDAPDVLARQFSLPALPLPPDGPVTVDIELSGRPLEKMEGLVALAAPGADVSASGSLSFLPAVATGAPDLSRPEYEARLTAGIKDSDPWLFMFGLALPGAGEGTPLSLAADAKGSEGIHEFSGISGQVSGNGYSGALTLSLPPAGRAKLSGNLAFDTLSLPVLAEFVTGPGTFGQSLDGLSETEFQAPPVPGIDGELALSARRLETGFGEAAQDFSAQATMIEGALTLSQISAEWLGGQYSGSISLNNLAGNATADLRGNVSGFDMARALVAAGHPGAMMGVGDAGFSLDAEGRSLKGLVSGLAGSGNISVRDLNIAGVRAGNLADLFPTTDGEGFVVDSGSVAPLAER